MFRRLFVFWVCGLWSLVCGLAFAQSSPFRVLSPEGQVALKPGETRTVRFFLNIPPDYFVYQDKTTLEFLNLEGIRVKNIRYPETVLHQDPFFKKEAVVFKGETPIEVTFEAPPEAMPGPRELEALLKLQGCSATLCYPEESHLVVFHLEVPGNAGGAALSGNASPGQPASKPFSLYELLHLQDFNRLFEQGWLIILAVVFIGGVLTSLTPCVLPLIPITLMIIGVRAESPVRRNLLLSFSLVLGLSLTYASLGVLAVALGKSLGFIFQQKWFVLGVAGLFFALSLSMLGFYEIHLPRRLRHRLNHVKGHGMIGAFVSGAVSGFLAAPCAGPVVGSLLLFVATTRSWLQGFWLLFIYALGMGFLFILLGTGYGTLQARFRRFALSVWIKRGMGIVLLLGAFFYFNSVIPIQDKLTAFLEQEPASPVVWLASDKEGLERARAGNKVMLIDFYADWCVPCKELELGFFRKPGTVALLQQMVPVRIDATFPTPDIQTIIRKYGVIGWPTILFVNPEGEVLRDLSVISYNPDLLFQNMQKAAAISKQ